MYIRKNTSKQRPLIMYFEFIRFLKHCSFTR